MVPRGGIEPTTLSLEGFCSSTELPGQKIMKYCRFHRQKNLFLGHLHLSKFPAKKFFFLEIFVFDYFFSEERIVRKTFLSNRILQLYLLFGSFPDRRYPCSSFLTLIEVVDTIDIDDLPPSLTEEISKCTSEEAYSNIEYTRHHHTEKPVDVRYRYDTVAYEYDKARKINKKWYKDEKHYHQENIKSTFHRVVDYVWIVALFPRGSKYICIFHEIYRGVNRK